MESGRPGIKQVDLDKNLSGQLRINLDLDESGVPVIGVVLDTSIFSGAPRHVRKRYRPNEYTKPPPSQGTDVLMLRLTPF